MATKIHILKFPKKERGAVSIMLALMVMMIILIVTLTVANIMVFEIKMSREISNDIPAFYAADSGAEQCLYEVLKNYSDVCNFNTTLDNGAVFTSVKTAGVNEINSNGTFGKCFWTVWFKTKSSRLAECSFLSSGQMSFPSFLSIDFKQG